MTRRIRKKIHLIKSPLHRSKIPTKRSKPTPISFLKLKLKSWSALKRIKRRTAIGVSKSAKTQYWLHAKQTRTRFGPISAPRSALRELMTRSRESVELSKSHVPSIRKTYISIMHSISNHLENTMNSKWHTGPVWWSSSTRGPSMNQKVSARNQREF